MGSQLRPGEAVWLLSPGSCLRSPDSHIPQGYQGSALPTQNTYFSPN
jgi:hypothetical protein